MTIKKWVAVLALCVPLLATASQEEVRTLMFADAIAAREAARAVNANVYSPRNFGEASEAFADADRDMNANRNLDRIRTGLARSTELFRAAEKVAQQAAISLAGAIKLRQAARSVDAALHDERNWQTAERYFGEAIVEFEQGGAARSERRAKDAEGFYRQAELAGIKAAYLTEAKRLLGQAEEARAERYAPQTFNEANQLLAEAEKELTENRYDTDRPRDLARQAQYESRHALFLANEVQRARKENIEAEGLIRAGETPLQQIAGVADLSVGFDKGYEVATVMIADYIKGLQSRNRKIEQELYESTSQIETLQTQLASLERRFGGISDERLALEEQLARQAHERERFNRVESMFTDDQGQVLRKSGDIIIRLVGTSFPVGKATIEPYAFGLLKTVMAAVRVYPEAHVTIEGHTDAYGGDELNMKLSKERADAVRAYLLANM
ncbi:MAG: OmpA family protein, partial [Gammaproteobacteria bacterium]|nr:OmpA family protein [Gammaproteobacteria bacterium]